MPIAASIDPQDLTCVDLHELPFTLAASITRSLHCLNFSRLGIPKKLRRVMQNDLKMTSRENQRLKMFSKLKFDRKSLETRNGLNVDIVSQTLLRVQQKAKPAKNVKGTIILLNVVSRNHLQMNLVKSQSKRLKTTLQIQFKENIIESSKLKLQSPFPDLILMSMCIQYKVTRFEPIRLTL